MDTNHVEVVFKNESERKHFYICRRLGEIYSAKNHDYGDSFHKTFNEFGRVALAIRLQDKCSRLTSLCCKEKQMVKDESIIDTLLDIANYAILGIMELEGEDNEMAKNN